MKDSGRLCPAGPPQLETLLPLVREFYEHFGYPYDGASKRAALERLLADATLGCVWLIEADGHPAGYVILSFYFSLEFGGPTAFVDELFVAPAWRGRGVGTRALSHVTRAAEELGLAAIHLEAERTNRRAAALYARLGFVDYGRTLMTKRLRGRPVSSSAPAPRRRGS